MGRKRLHRRRLRLSFGAWVALGAVLALLNLPGAIPAGGTSAPARPRPMLDPVPAWAVPIQITNAQSAATGTYQQMVVVNSSRYSAYLNANDSNVGWAYPNGTAIYAWMESNATNTSARTTWWLKLYNIPADSNQTVYLDIYGETSYLLSLYGPSGEAPQLSATYGGLDDGARVFTDYWNFSSATNAVSFSSYAACSDPVSQTATFSDGLIFGAHASCQWYASSVGIQTPAIVDSTGWCYVVSLAGACYGVMLSNLQTTWSGILYLRQVVGTPTWSCSGVSCPAAPVAVTGANYTLTVSMSPSGADANISVNYTSTVTQSVAISTTYWVGVNADNNTASHFYWLRVRAYPPNGIMPTAAFVSQVNGSIAVGGVVGTHYANPFFAVAGAPPSLGATPTWYGNYFNNSPIAVYRFGGHGNGYDPTTNLTWVPPSGSGAYVDTGAVPYDLRNFVAWCYSRHPACSWLQYLPGEDNNTTAAVHTAEWFQNVLGHQPTYWEFGNEPNSWTHYGINVTAWNTADNSVPTAAGYATMEVNYYNAVHALYPADKFVSGELASVSNTAMIQELAALMGTKSNAIAYHTYPSAPGGNNATAQQYLGILSTSGNISTTIAAVRSNVTIGCASCGNWPVQVGEFNNGPNPLSSANLYRTTETGAVFVAASIVQALYANLSMFTYFDSGYLVSSTGVTGPGVLYSYLLPNLTMGLVDSVNVTGAPLNQHVYSVLMKNATSGGRESLFSVNANTLYSINLTISAAALTGSAFTVYQWSPSSAYPTVSHPTSLSGHYTVPADGILLVDNYNSTGQPQVPASPTGLTVGAVTATTVALSWSNPSGVTVQNDTVFYGTSCSSLTHTASTEGVSTGVTVAGLAADTTYCFEVEDWVGGVGSLPSASVTATTLPAVLPSNPPGIVHQSPPIPQIATFPPPLDTFHILVALLAGVGILMLLFTDRKYRWAGVAVTLIGVLAFLLPA